MSRFLFKYFLLVILFIATDAFCQEQLIFKSENLPGNDTVWIFKPDNYSINKKYPIVYMLHGLNGNYRSFNNLTNLQQISDEFNFIIICPDGFHDSFFLNSPIIKNSQFETFFIEELYPEINRLYSTDTVNIFITGLSMGGGGAMSFFLKHPQLFASAASTSGLMDLSYSSQRDKKLLLLLGDYKNNTDVFYNFSAVSKVSNIKGTGKKILFDCGTDDYLYKCNLVFKNECDKYGIDAEFISGPGNHNIDYWRSTIKNHFIFFRNISDNQQN